MNTETRVQGAKLLKAVTYCPTYDSSLSARLVYSDWLLENGMPLVGNTVLPGESSMVREAVNWLRGEFKKPLTRAITVTTMASSCEGEYAFAYVVHTLDKYLGGWLGAHPMVLWRAIDNPYKYVVK